MSNDQTAVNEDRASMEPLLVKAAVAAKLLGIGQRKLWTMTNCGDIPCVRFGSSVRYSPTALRHLIAKKMKGGR